jgi:hypothetical protein
VTLAIAMMSAGAAAAKPSPPEPLRASEIPAGTEWWCYAMTGDDDGVFGCRRSKDDCDDEAEGWSKVMEVKTPACVRTAPVWVRTGFFDGGWVRVVAPSKRLCEIAPNWNLGVIKHDSGCHEWRDPPPAKKR